MNVATMAAFEAAGLMPKHKLMPNGEKRYSIGLPDGSALILTIAGETAKWQDAHSHRGTHEHYAVLQGTMVFARELSLGDRRVIALRQNDVVTTYVGEAHNVLLLPGTVITTVKSGVPIGNPDRNGNDWWPADDRFDQWTNALDSEKLRSWYGIQL